MTGLLVKVRGDGRAFAERAQRFGGGLDVQPILTLRASAEGSALVGDGHATWLKLADTSSSGHAWDDAHALLNGAAGFAAAADAQIEAIEPDIGQDWGWSRPSEGKGGGDPALRGAAAADDCQFDDQDGSGGRATVPRRPAWHLGDDYSRLKRARDEVGAAQAKIRIAHLDTGYDPGHVTLPRNMLMDRQANFVEGGAPDDATDRISRGAVLSNRGHGTGTLSLLAGNRIDERSGFSGFTDFLGGAPECEVIPIRIADWVVRFTTGTIVQGIEHARRNGAHVLSMSMGGVTSQALTDAVNLAYDDGMVLVTAGGNNIARLPSPKTIVYPARLKRVIAACGVMADGRAYAGLSPGTMQGNYGPAEKMATAIGAYTPNVPWAQIGCGTIVDMDGAGTSAATPQVAAAAALWLAHHWDIVGDYPEAWMRVAAVRKALFDSAAKSTARMDAAETLEKIGQGVLNAEAALAMRPAKARDLEKLPPSEPSWPWLSLIFGEGGAGFAAVEADRRRRAMLALELTQMAQRVAAVEAAMPSPERKPDAIGFAERNRYLEAALDAGEPSQALRAVLERHLGRPGKAASAAVTARPDRPRRKIVEPGPPPRRLRVYALDPSLAKRLDTLPVNETVLSLPWDDYLDDDVHGQGPLKPGPVGEYLEVIDVDPASGKAYEPVDLNDPWLLAQNGLPPSEGNPKFHQQMVYAVAMKTIGAFEKALGRRALWGKHRPRGADGRYGDDAPVRRLRIYPHALRSPNAYYSPNKVALLFGYFPADSTQNDATAPGSMVFTCLSSDIVSHEMSHALLDGLHRHFQENSNPDVAAFHEGFADIVAIFQHFTIPELVRFEIGRARGRLDAATLLAGLAAQFGEGSGIGGALRDYLSPKTRARRYATTVEPHDRGEILVLAVYDAFLAIVQRRTADLVRIATGGTGILPSGALHPDLVERLADETCKAAGHVLRMCIRALDYCPAIDITFEEYLRAIITADVDLVPEDPYGYRIAFMEAFRSRGIPMRSVRTVSVESLTWNTPATNDPPWVAKAFAKVDFGVERRAHLDAIVSATRRNRWALREALEEAFRADPDYCCDLGLRQGVALYGPDGKEIRPAKDVTTFDVFDVRPAQRIAPDGSLQRTIVTAVHQRRPEAVDGKDVANGFFWFRSGATLILDADGGKPQIRYIVVKSADSERRLELQRRMESGGRFSSLRRLYFGDMDGEPFAMMHADRGERDHG